MKILVFGAGGIIGQHMMLSKPDGVEAGFYRRRADRLFQGIDLGSMARIRECLSAERPDAIVNLAGESNPDVVERAPKEHWWINEIAPVVLASECDDRGIHYVHVSSQIVLDPVNAYGQQKAAADKRVAMGGNWTIAMPSCVLGIRPLWHVGRPNPIETMLLGEQLEEKDPQVNDRRFSPSFARDVARQLWRIAMGPAEKRVIQLGIPVGTTRYGIAKALGVEATPVSHDSFVGFAARPMDTTFGENARSEESLADGLTRCREEHAARHTGSRPRRSRELALFLGIREEVALARLNRGFAEAHVAVKEDFRKSNPKTDEALLAWYRTTESYLWELSAYHADERFNYDGMCHGIAQRLHAEGMQRILCLGDGIGTLTSTLGQTGLNPVYHDLAGSRTAEFAAFRYWAYWNRELPQNNSTDWAPPKSAEPYDAVVSLDFLEHVTDVPEWASAIHGLLRPGGLFFCQNAFACGSGPQGSIPCHLERNDRFEKDWDPLLASLGFVQESSNWYRVPAIERSQPAA